MTLLHDAQSRILALIEAGGLAGMLLLALSVVAFAQTSDTKITLVSTSGLATSGAPLRFLGQHSLLLGAN